MFMGSSFVNGSVRRLDVYLLEAFNLKRRREVFCPTVVRKITRVWNTVVLRTNFAVACQAQFVESRRNKIAN
jgi:hypothetical protein